jgi:hypothetical protein
VNRRLIVNSILGAIFVASLVGVVIGMNHLRDAALRSYGTERSQADWEKWRADIAEESKAFEIAAKGKARKDGSLPPVKRRVSKAAEPPALLLMRDRYAVCLTAALLLSGAMIGSILLLIRGAILTGGTTSDGQSDREDSGS